MDNGISIYDESEIIHDAAKLMNKFVKHRSLNNDVVGNIIIDTVARWILEYYEKENGRG